MLVAIVMGVLSLGRIVHADEPVLLFQEGVRFAEAGKLEEAQQSLERNLVLEPRSALVFYNLGVVFYKKGNLGPAVGNWRKSLVLAPFFSPPRDALRFLNAKNPALEIIPATSLWEVFRFHFLTRLDGNIALFLLALSLLFFGWAWIRPKEDPSNHKAKFFSAILLALVVGLAAAKSFDFYHLRATVLKETSARTGPGPDTSELFLLREGAEVLELETVQKEGLGSWTRVELPGGLSGWVQKDTLMTTAGWGT